MKSKTSSADIAENEKRNIDYRTLLAFFLPLAVTPFFISSIHSIMNAAMARLPYPEISIAVFTVVKGISNAVKAPDRMFMQIIVSMVDDRQSFYLASKFIWITCAGFFAVLFLLAYTPLGGWFLVNIIGLEDPETIRFAYRAMRITCFLPVVETLRNVHRGLVISHEQTRIVTAGTAVRLVAISLFLFWAVSSQAISGVVAAGLAWTAGIGIEGTVVLLGVIYFYSSPGKAAEKITKNKVGRLKLAQILTFFLPLAAMRFLRSFLQPVIQSGIARSQVDPTQALAAFGVAYGLMVIIVGPLRNLHQCALVYVGEDDFQSWQKVKRFCLIAGVLLTLVMLIICFTPLGFMIMHYIIGVSEPVAELGRLVLIGFSVLPIIRAAREAYWGILMEQQNTTLIGYGKGLNLAAVFLSFIILLRPLTAAGISPAVIGAIAFTVGQAVETFLICYYSSSNLKPASLSDSLF